MTAASIMRKPVKKIGGLYWSAILASENMLDQTAYIMTTMAIDMPDMIPLQRVEVNPLE
jgi:hypothetical protein